MNSCPARTLRLHLLLALQDGTNSVPPSCHARPAPLARGFFCLRHLVDWHRLKSTTRTRRERGHDSGCQIHSDRLDYSTDDPGVNDGATDRSEFLEGRSSAPARDCRRGIEGGQKNDLALGATQDPKAKELLENAKETFINIARGLAAKTWLGNERSKFSRASVRACGLGRPWRIRVLRFAGRWVVTALFGVTCLPGSF